MNTPSTYEQWNLRESQTILDSEILLLNESVEDADKFDLAKEEQDMVRNFLVLFAESECTMEDIQDYLENPTNESVLGKVIGGIGGFALGKKIGRFFAKVLGVEKGVLYDLFTSRLVGAAMGSILGGKVL